jgi:hypothetical protein
MGRISRGWALTQQSWDVLRKDRSLLVFPILAAVFAVVATAAIWFPAAILRGFFAGHPVDNHDPVIYIALGVAAYISTFFSIFFNVALASCAVRSMRGEDTKVSEGISAAMKRLGPIIAWTLVTTTVGLILKILEERLPFLGRIAVWLAGAAWEIATFFVVPVVALEGTGPWESLKRSVNVVKARWGEGATGAATIGLVTFLITFGIILVGGAGTVALFAAGVPLLGIILMGVVIAAVMVVALISSALSQIFRVAVYQYGVSGEAPTGFDGQMLQNAFRIR